MFHFLSCTRSSAVLKFAVAGVSLASIAALAPAASAQAPANDRIPDLASISFAWLSVGADSIDPPGTPGPGPIKADPAHPFLGNVEALRSGRQPTLRIGDAKDPILKPWAAAEMQASNEEALSGIRQVP